jgi:hypothetical protein
MKPDSDDPENTDAPPASLEGAEYAVETAAAN